ncbi:MAG: MFS transporter [Candidatus Eremiobacterota bacterium]
MASRQSTAKLVFRSLGNRNYLLFFIGQGISLIGTWFQFTAMSWLIYRLTASSFLLGVVSFTGQFPAFILSPFAGVIADRINRKNVLIITQALYMVQSLILALLVLNNSITIWQVILLSLLAGIISGFDMTVRNSFVSDMVENKEHLGNAIALNSSLFNLARLIGPTVAGLVISMAGEGLCFLINSISFLSIILALLAMKINRAGRDTKKLEFFQGIKDGFSYAFDSVPIKMTLFLTGIISLTVMPYGVIMPVFAKEIFHGGPQTLGFLMSASGLGAFAGALAIASKETSRGFEKLISTGAFISGISLAALAFSSNFYISMVLIFLTGFGMIIFFTSSNTLVQTTAEEHMCGRVMSLYTMSFMGTMPLGSIFAGSLSQKIGVQYTVLIGGLSCLIGALIFIMELRKKYTPACS